MTFYSGYYPGEKVEKEVYSYENYDDLVKKLDELLEKRMFSRSKMIDIFSIKEK
jgi:metal-responsive CopG/Arc/MetJ family transcriptional regulator